MTQVHDLHVTDWHSQSTSAGPGGKEFGRIVGWAYAKILPPRLEEILDAELAPEELETQKDVSNKPTPVDESTDIPRQEVDQTPLDPGPTEAPISAPVPCEACGWIWPLLLGILCLWLCSWQWALLAVTPFLMKCLISKIEMSTRKIGRAHV